MKITQIKNNILINEDCLVAMDYLIEKGVKVNAIITDPPYGTTSCKWDSVIPFDEMWKRLKLLRKENTAIVLFGSEPFSSALRMSNIREYKYDWIWDKKIGTGFLNANKQPLRACENIIVFYSKQCVYNPQKFKGTPCHKRGSNIGKKLSSMNTYGNTKYVDTNGDMKFPINIISNEKIHSSNVVHPTQKPVALIEYLVKTYTNEGDIVLDFTMGSGTTGVACQNLNRKFIGIEFNPEKDKEGNLIEPDKYFKIAVERITKAGEEKNDK